MSWTQGRVAGVLRDARPEDDKYRRGVLGVWTGSREYPGAAVLGVEGAMRTGVGMVRYLGEAAELVLARRPEVVTQPGQVSAWLIGSGMPEISPTDVVLARIRSAQTPVVCDAAALDPLVLDQLGTATLLLTPHAGEAARLLGVNRSDVDAHPERLARALAERWSATVVLKGSVTTVAAADGRTDTLGPASPKLATAGTGDVLAGILGALAASTPEADPFDLAGAAVWLHSATAAELTGPILALELAERVAGTIARCRGERP